MDDGQTDNEQTDDGHPMITKAHLEPMAQVIKRHCAAESRHIVAFLHGKSIGGYI